MFILSLPCCWDDQAEAFGHLGGVGKSVPLSQNLGRNVLSAPFNTQEQIDVNWCPPSSGRNLELKSNTNPATASGKLLARSNNRSMAACKLSRQRE